MKVSRAVSFRRVYSELTPQEFDDGMDAATFHGLNVEVRAGNHSMIILVRPNERQIEVFEDAIGVARGASDTGE